MNKLLLVYFLVFTVSFSLSGQRVTPTPDDLYADAQEFMLSGDYYDALLLFLSLKERGYVSPNISFKIGECYLNLKGQKTKAIPYLKEAVQKVDARHSGNSLLEEYAPAKALLFLGVAYRLNNDFDNALIYFNQYRQSLDDVDKDNIRVTEFHIERCNNALELMASPATFTTDTLPDVVNTATSNFNPLVTSDEKVLYYMDQLKFYDAVKRSGRVETAWTDPENLTPLLRSDGDHYVTGMSAEGNRLFLTYYDPYQSGEIFTAEFGNNQWTEMQKLNGNINTVFNETHASLSPDGKSLYFTSDRKGGYGGLDIYCSVKNAEGQWDKPVNLGPVINSPYNEESPFITAQGRKLYFSSQGHYNMGGYDIFCSSLDAEGNWLPPVNIGYPLNTTDDDVFFFPLDTGNIAYQARISSNTAGSDIVRYLVHSFGSPVRFTVNGQIDLKADPDFNASGLSVAFISKPGMDTISNKPLNDNGTFRQRIAAGSYNVVFTKGRSILLTRELNIPDYFPYANLVMHEELQVPATELKDTLYLKDIRFAFNSDSLPAVYHTYLDELARLMLKYPDLAVQVNGFTDALGSESYNLKLSLWRANTVSDFLKQKTSQPDRISVNGYGELNPVALNKNANGTDNPQGRQFNRRAELIVNTAPKGLVVIRIIDIPAALLNK